jgi:hypothetical protein
MIYISFFGKPYFLFNNNNLALYLNYNPCILRIDPASHSALKIKNNPNTDIHVDKQR